MEVGLRRSGTLLELPRELGLRGVTELCELARFADELLTRYPFGKSAFGGFVVSSSVEFDLF